LYPAKPFAFGGDDDPLALLAGRLLCCGTTFPPALLAFDSPVCAPLVLAAG
jgi:hypothetical protein